MHQASEFGLYKSEYYHTGEFHFAPIVTKDVLEGQETGGFSLQLLYETHGGTVTGHAKTKFCVIVNQKSIHTVLPDRSIAKESTSETKESSHASRAMTLLKSSGKFKFIEACKLFDLKKIDPAMTLSRFKMLRKKNDIPIKDYLFKERYE